jgi:hypothetical protein
MPGQSIKTFNPHKRKAEYMDTGFFRELAQGERYIRPDGKELIIGVSKQAEEVNGE